MTKTTRHINYISVIALKQQKDTERTIMVWERTL